MTKALLTLAFCACAATGVYADAYIDLPECAGLYPNSVVTELTLPDNMEFVSHLGAIVTHTDTPGIRHNPDTGEDEEYHLRLWMQVYAPATDAVAYCWFDPGYTGAPVTQVVPCEYHQIQLFWGQPVTVTVWAEHPQYGEIVEPASMDVSSFQLGLFGNIVANEQTSYSTIKGLFE